MKFIPILQLTTALIVIILILLQERTSGAGGLFGGGGGEFYQRRRGVERILFIATIVSALLFTLLSILHLLY